MKKTGILLILLCLASVLLTTESFAQPGMRWKGSGGWGAKGLYGRMYDVDSRFIYYPKSILG